MRSFLLRCAVRRKDARKMLMWRFRDAKSLISIKFLWERCTRPCGSRNKRCVNTPRCSRGCTQAVSNHAIEMTSFLPHAAAYLRKVSMDGEC